MQELTVTFKLEPQTPRPRQPRELKPLKQPLDRSVERLLRRQRRLAMAHLIERLVEDGHVDGYVEIARALGITRAAVTQTVRLVLLPCAEQERILRRSGPSPSA